MGVGHMKHCERTDLSMLTPQPPSHNIVALCATLNKLCNSVCYPVK